MAFFFKKQAAIIGQLTQFQDRMEDMMFAYREVFKSYFEGNSRFDEVVKKVGNIESEMDTLRKKIQLEMYENSLMPDSREDILYLIDALDQLPNLMEHTALRLSWEKPDIPTELHAEILVLIEKVALVIKALVEATDCLFRDLRSVRGHATEVSRQEAESDTIEFSLIKRIFEMDIELARKNQIRTVIDEISRVADLGEDAAEMILIFATKRAV